MMDLNFSNVGQDKLDSLLKDGWTINGYSIQKDDRKGFITNGGFVGWWYPEYYDNHTSNQYYAVICEIFNGDFTTRNIVAIRSSEAAAKKTLDSFVSTDKRISAKYYTQGPFFE